jgi:hypothetical protein
MVYHKSRERNLRLVRSSDKTDEWRDSYEIAQKSSEIVPPGAPLSIFFSTKAFNRFEPEPTPRAASDQLFILRDR